VAISVKRRNCIRRGQSVGRAVCSFEVHSCESLQPQKHEEGVGVIERIPHKITLMEAEVENYEIVN
jgi:hypothetical protein